MATFDEIFQHIGSCGRFQLRYYFLLCLLLIPVAIHIYLNTFLFATPLHRCRLQSFPNHHFHLNSSSPEGRLLPKLIPFSNNSNSLDSCHFIEHTGSFPNISIHPNASLRKCNSWVADPSFYSDNVVTMLNLYCDREYFVTIANSMVFVGILIGSLVFGEISDRFGRQWSLNLAILGLLVFGIGTAYLKTYWSIVAFRTVACACAHGVGLVAFVWGMEVMGPSARTNAGIVVGFFFAAGTMLLGVAAFYIRAWVWLQLACSIPIAVFLPYFFAIPESPRWLLSKGKLIRFKKVVSEAASLNKKSLPKTMMEDLVNFTIEKQSLKSLTSVSVLTLIRLPNMAFKSVILFYAWLVINMTYYGITMNLTSLPGSPFLKLIISGAVEIPAHLVLLVVLHLTGRRIILSLSLVLSGISCFLCACVHQDNVINGLAQFGKLCIAASFSVVYIFSAELFPTCLRTVGLGLCSFFARLGGIFATVVIQAAKTRHQPELPLAVFGIMAFTSGVMVLALPETRNTVLPETLEQAEAFGNTKWCCRSRTERPREKGLFGHDASQSLLTSEDWSEDESKISI